MVGNNYEWKVGDIDRALNGNFKIIAWPIFKHNISSSIINSFNYIQLYVQLFYDAKFNGKFLQIAIN